jgi:catechol 2,3-dioxygenase-like lactoylglutathione lyase family enzyme
VRGINHMAFPTFDPAGTIGFYRDVLGLPLVQTMQVKAWGPEYQRDFVHFFFDIGNADCLAFFYYFGQEPYRDENLPPLLDLGSTSHSTWTPSRTSTGSPSASRTPG